MWLLRSRFLKVELTVLQRATLPFHRLRAKVCRVFDARRAKIRHRTRFERTHPFLRIHAPHPGTWIADASVSGGKRWEGQKNWRTQIGPAIVCWDRGALHDSAWNIRTPDGSRQDLRQSMLGWRRRAKPPMVWIYGRLILHEDDVEFVDLDAQPGYAPPALADIPNLEAELAGLKDFVTELQDDSFALKAFYQLAYREWMKIGHREFHVFDSNGSIAHMIAGLRGKGENYLDVEFETLGGREEPLKIANSESHAQRLQSLLATIGWRTHTVEEIQAIFREDLRQRLRARVELLRQIKLLETRSTGHHRPWMDQAPYGALPLAIYEDDDPAWLEELSAEEREASAGELSLRLFALATNAQIDQKEYDGLKQKLGVKLLGL